MASYSKLSIVFLVVIALLTVYAKPDASAGGLGASSGTGWSSSPAGSFGGSSASGWGTELDRGDDYAKASSGYNQENNGARRNDKFTGWIMNE